MRPDRVRQRYGLRADMESAPYVFSIFSCRCIKKRI